MGVFVWVVGRKIGSVVGVVMGAIMIVICMLGIGLGQEGVGVGVKKVGCGFCSRYFLFLYIAVVSFIALTSSNPVSIAWVSSVMLCVTVLVHSSFGVWYSAFSRVMYSSVLLMFWCPNTFLT